MIFKQPHNDRRSNIIGQICNNFDRSALILFFYQLSDINFEHVFVDHTYIVIAVKRIFQNRDQSSVDLYCDYFSCRT